jgi:hypothetical protein
MPAGPTSRISTARTTKNAFVFFMISSWKKIRNFTLPQLKTKWKKSINMGIF